MSHMAKQVALFGIVVGVALLLSGIGFLALALGGAPTPGRLRPEPDGRGALPSATRSVRRRGRGVWSSLKTTPIGEMSFTAARTETQTANCIVRAQTN